MIRLIDRYVYRISLVIITMLLVSILSLASMQVISRFVFSFSIDFSQELIVVMLTWLVFLGCSAGLHDHALVRLTALIDRLPKRICVPLEIFCNILIIVFFVITIIANEKVLKLGWKAIMPVLDIPTAVLSLSYTVSAIIMIFYTTLATYDIFKANAQYFNKKSTRMEDVQNG